jgi:hypothetical protein
MYKALGLILNKTKQQKNEDKKEPNLKINLFRGW